MTLKYTVESAKSLQGQRSEKRVSFLLCKAVALVERNGEKGGPEMPFQCEEPATLRDNAATYGKSEASADQDTHGDGSLVSAQNSTAKGSSGVLKMEEEFPGENKLAVARQLANNQSISFPGQLAGQKQ